MKKSMICIVGNMATGKTSVSTILQSKLKEFEYFSIDDFRIRHNTINSVEGEMNAIENLKNEVIKKDNIILECTGTGKYFQELKDNFEAKNGRVYVVKLNCDSEILKERIRDRIKQVPFPYQIDIEKSLEVIANKTKKLFANLTINTEVHDLKETVSIILSKLDERKIIDVQKKFLPKAPKVKPEIKNISLKEVLRELQTPSNENKTFELVFVSIATGKIRTIQAKKEYRQKKNGTNAVVFTDTVENQRDGYKIIIENNLIMIKEVGSKNPITPKEFLIIGFNNLNVIY